MMITPDHEHIFRGPQSVDRETINILQNANSISPTTADWTNHDRGGGNDRLTKQRYRTKQYDGTSIATTQTNEQGPIFRPVEAWT